jgi:Skp family chaperone for outer membrane proteins
MSTPAPDRLTLSIPRRTLALALVAVAGIGVGSVWQGLIGSANATPAAARQAAPSTSIAVVDLNRMVGGLEEMVEKIDRLQKEADSSRARLEELASRIKAVDGELEMMGTQDIRARRAKMQEKFELESLLKARHDSLKRLLDLEMGGLMRSTYLKIQESATRFGQDNGWDLILVDDRDGLPEQVTPEQIRQMTENRQVLHVGRRIDITDQLITMMNNEYKAGRR